MYIDNNNYNFDYIYDGVNKYYPSTTDYIDSVFFQPELKGRVYTFNSNNPVPLVSPDIVNYSNEGKGLYLITILKSMNPDDKALYVISFDITNIYFSGGVLYATGFDGYNPANSVLLTASVENPYEYTITRELYPNNPNIDRPRYKYIPNQKYGLNSEYFLYVILGTIPSVLGGDFFLPGTTAAIYTVTLNLEDINNLEPVVNY